MPLYFQPMASFQDDDGCLNKKKTYARRYHRRKNGKMNLSYCIRTKQFKISHRFLDILHFLLVETE